MLANLMLAALIPAAAMAGPPPPPPDGAGSALILAQATSGGADATTTTSAPGVVTPEIAATVRGQTTTFTKTLIPAPPVTPQAPRRPTRLSSTPFPYGRPTATPPGVAGPQGPVGLPR